MSLIRTLTAGAALAASLSAHAGLVGQSVTLFFNGESTASTFNATFTPVGVGSGVETTHADLGSTVPTSAFGDGGVAFDLADNTLTVEFSNGTNGRIQKLGFGVQLLDPNTTFSNLSTVFDNFLGVSAGGWTTTLMSPSLLMFSIDGLSLGAPQNQYSQSAQFHFDVTTVATSPITPAPTPNPSAVPEPGSFALAGLALLGLAGVRRHGGRTA